MKNLDLMPKSWKNREHQDRIRSQKPETRGSTTNLVRKNILS